MKAVRIEEHGGPDVIQWIEVPDPSPGPGEVLVKVHASGMNHLDLWVRRGIPGHPFPLPITPGCDGAGVVTELGAGVEGPSVGSPVMLSPGLSCGTCERCLSGNDPLCRKYGILGETRDGAAAELVVVPAANVIPIPDSIRWEEAASFGLVALTAWTMLVERARVRPGENVLVLAGGSGVGSLGIQIAKLFGARVIATAGGEEKCRKVRALGADEVIDHSTMKISKRVRELTDGRGVDIVFEHVGEATWKESLRSLDRGGRLVTCGATTGHLAECDLRLVFFKSISILGSTMGSKGTLLGLVDLLAAGKLRPVVGEVLPMSRAAEAHALLEERKVFGKVVLTV